MAGQVPNPDRRPSARRALILATLLALLTGLGLFGHQAGFIVWDMQGVDLGFTQVARAGSDFGHPTGAAAVSEDLSDATELLRRTGSSDSDNIPAVDPFAVPDGLASSALKSNMPAAKPQAKVARLANDADHERDVQGEVEARDRALDQCDAGSTAPGCVDTHVDDVDDPHDDDVTELALAAVLEDDLSDSNEADKDGHDDRDREECREREDFRDRDRDRDDRHRGGRGHH